MNNPWPFYVCFFVFERKEMIFSVLNAFDLIKKGHSVGSVDYNAVFSMGVNLREIYL